MGTRVVWPNFEVFKVLPEYIRLRNVLSWYFSYSLILKPNFELFLLDLSFDFNPLRLFVNHSVFFVSFHVSLPVEVALVVSVQAAKHLLNVASVL